LFGKAHESSANPTIGDDEMREFARTLELARSVARMPALSLREQRADVARQRQHLARAKALLCLTNTPIGAWAQSLLERGTMEQSKTDIVFLLDHLDALLSVRAQRARSMLFLTSSSCCCCCCRQIKYTKRKHWRCC
jgi:hypothetical protein